MIFAVPILAAVFALGLWLVLGRPRFPDQAEQSAAAAKVSIIIPARDEEASLGGLLESINSQHRRPHEIIVVDDGSTDRTAAIAEAHGARVINPPALPDDWKGKPWACQQGAAAATGDWLLFLDADTRLAPGAMGKIASLSSRADRVHSICPHHTVHRPYEQLSAFFNVIMLAGVNAFGIQRDPSNHAALFGQCMLISRIHHEQVGGHQAVRAEILENFHLARHLGDLGIPRECHLGRGCLTMRMFPGGLSELWASWKKGFTSGAKNAAPRALLFISIWITGAMLACVGIVVALTPFAGPAYRVTAVAVYLLYALQCLRAFRLAGSFSPLTALFFPVSLMFYQVLFFTALIERRLGIKTQWKGRHVD